MPRKQVNKEEKAQRTRTEAHGRLLAAEVEYLHSYGWLSVAPDFVGAPVEWIDPMTKRRFSQDTAVATQKVRQVEINRANRKI